MFIKSSIIITLLSLQAHSETLREQRENLLKTLQTEHQLNAEQIAKIRGIMEATSVMGQGNPEMTKHPMSREECKTKSLPKLQLTNEPSCPGKNMALMKGPEGAVCIDQFEFPNIACEYPMVWVQANEAAQICEVMGKRLCDAHEWEGGCHGELTAADYPYDAGKGLKDGAAFEKMRAVHNANATKSKRYAYGGSEYKKGICGANSTKDANCNGGDWKRCGSNTYPAGSFPECKSPYAVYDQHGNAAEHMNLPLSPEQRSSHPSKKLGHTEMKGSWFIFDKFHAHQDWCRWRAPYWHGTTVMHPKSHHNYHLGFRCCANAKN